MSAALTELSLLEASQRLRERSLTSAELTEAYLARIAAHDGRLRNYITVTAERARADAARLDAELAQGRWRGPLHGVPIAVKDLFDTAGVLTSANSHLLADNVPTVDATVTQRLGAAGTVLLGKLHMNEFATGPLFEDDFRPPARNPWNTERVTGGSSAGSGGALAAGLCAGSYGSDTGGSIRGPAAYCGIVGLKPTYGRVSRHGVAMLSWSFDHVGPMARTVADVAALLEATAGHDAADPASAAVPVPDYQAALDGAARGVRVGIPTAYLASLAEMEPDVQAAFDAAVAVLRDLGAEVREIELPHVDLLDGLYNPILSSEAAANHQAWMVARGQEYGRGFRRRVLEGYLYSAVEYVQAQRGCAMFTAAYDRLMTTVDVIAMPTHDRTAPTFVVQNEGPRSWYTRIFNVTGQPALSQPCGFDREGLPIGLMLATRRFEEPLLFRVADAYERATPWRERRPELDQEPRGATTTR